MAPRIPLRSRRPRESRELSRLVHATKAERNAECHIIHPPIAPAHACKARHVGQRLLPAVQMQQTERAIPSHVVAVRVAREMRARKRYPLLEENPSPRQ